MATNLLEVKDLYVNVEDKEILHGINLTVGEDETHVLMGPNGTGKSTLSKVIMGDTSYKVTNGDITFDGTSINKLNVCERANLGIFLGMQMPPEIEGVSNADFLRTALHNKQKDNFKLYDFIKKIDASVENLKMNKDMIHRGINQGFSGGERKKNEILQLLVLNPKLAILDETDSGLDVDAIRTVSKGINLYKNEENAVLIITHNTRILQNLKVDYVHILVDGKIVKTGSSELAEEIEKEGYGKYKNEN